MSVAKISLRIGSFNVNIKIDKSNKIRDNSICRKLEHEKRVNEALKKRKDLSTSYNYFNNLF